jgi:hypothetical protein
MARIAIPSNGLIGTVDPAYLVLTTQAADDVTGHEWAFKEGDVLLAYNPGAGVHEVTLIATPDSQGRTVDSVQSVGIGALSVFGPLKIEGWRQTDGMVHVDTDDTLDEVLLAVIRR